MKPAPVRNPRQRTLAALSDVLDKGLNLADSPAMLDGRKSRDLSMGRHLAYGVLRWLTALEWLAGRLLSKPIKRRDSDVYRLILLGLYQIWQDQAPPHAAVHETTECARHIGKPWAVSLINAVLRRFQREQDHWLDQLAQVDEIYAHPPWMLEVLKTDWPRDWQAIAHANNQQSAMWLRLNRSGPDRETLIEGLEDQGFEVTRHASATDAVCITPSADVGALPGFRDGHLSVQDPAAQLAADLLDARAGMRVLDACAAPGGKTCHLLERAPGLQLTALDQNPQRIALIRQNLQRMKLNCRLITADAARTDDWWDGGPFQRILLDAPCSATGVIRRHPEIKHLRQPSQVAAAVRLQQELLHNLWPLLDPGGILVYATCSVFKDENNRQINNFLLSHPKAEEQASEQSWGQPLRPGRQVLPGEQDMDGFYYAVLRKIS